MGSLYHRVLIYILGTKFIVDKFGYHVLRDVVANEDEWIKGGAEENRQGKLTGPQKGKFLDWSFRKISYPKGVFCERLLDPQATL